LHRLPAGALLRNRWAVLAGEPHVLERETRLTQHLRGQS
jgi:hypothetical protein